MVLSPFRNCHRKGRLSAAPFAACEPRFEVGPRVEYPVPSLQKMMELSFSLPAILGSSASNIPSSLESNPAFSYFHGVRVRRSTSFPDPRLLLHPASAAPARATARIDRANMVRFSFISHDFP